MIKKYLITICFILFTITQAQAFNTSLCAQPPYPVSSGLPRFLSNATGTNFLLTTVAETAIEKSLKKSTGAKFKTQIYAYGGKNLIDGKFKTMTISAKNANISGVYVSKFEAQTMCEYNYVDPNKGDILFNENMLISYKSEISANDLKKTLFSDYFQKQLSNIELNVAGFVLLKVTDPDVQIVNNKIRSSFKVISPFFLNAQPYEISFEASPIVENGKIKFADIFVRSNTKKLGMNTIIPIINMLNPFMNEIRITKNAKAIIQVNSIKITNNVAHINGQVYIPKNNYIAK